MYMSNKKLSLQVTPLMMRKKVGYHRFKIKKMFISYSSDLDDLLCEEQLLFLDDNGYHPFPNKVFALLYLMIHGPRPVVSSQL